MFGNKHTSSSTPLVDAGTRLIDQTIGASRQRVNGAMDGLNDAVHQWRDNTVPVIGRLSHQAQTLARQGMDAVRDQSMHLKASARRTSDDTLHYIRDEPVKAVLIAATTGAVLMALASFLTRSQRDH